MSWVLGAKLLKVMGCKNKVIIKHTYSEVMSIYDFLLCNHKDDNIKGSPKVRHLGH